MKYFPVFLALFLVTGCEKKVHLGIHQEPTTSSGRQIWVGIGHSQMSGRGHEPSSFGPNPQILMLNRDNKWVVAQEPTGLVDIAATVSPMVAFANALLANDPNENIGIINCAAGGSTTSQWQPSYPLFKQCADRIKEAQKEGHIAGFICTLGENDQNEAGAWLEVFPVVVSAFRNLINNPSAPFAFTEVPSAWQSSSRDVVRADQEATHIHNAYLVSTEGLTLGDDGVHYNTAGNELLGQRFANAF